METYLIRVGAPLPFAQKLIDNDTDFFETFYKALPIWNKKELKQIRFTSGIFSLTAPSRGECEKIVKNAWHSAFPGEPDDISVMIYPDGENDESDLMYSVFSGYYGAEEYQKLALELAASIPYLKERGALRSLRMQSYLFAIDPGCGFTTLLSSLGNYFQRMGVYEDETEKRTDYVEYVIGKESEGNLTSVNDLINDLYCDSSENNKCIVGIDISYFLEGNRSNELRNFIHRLYKLQNKYIFAFKVPFLEKKALDNIASQLSDVALIRTVRIPPLHDLILLEYMWDEVRRLGYYPDSSLIDVYFRKISAEKQDGRFYGFKTAEKIINEMILNKARLDAEREAKGEKTDRQRIREEDAAGIEVKEKDKNTGLDALSELIGMEEIRKRVEEIVAQVKISLKNEKLDRPCIHMRFLGAPGTGKTTVARIIGQIFKEEGILRKGAFLEYSARSLCAEYIGQTAVKTAAICRDAYGSVLFLDEAYALYEGDQHTNDYGKEALTTLISEMENHRDDMLVIMAGYTDDMETLMDGNAGLRSRMPYMISFPNYTKTQLFEIYMLMVRKHFEYTEDLKKEAESYFKNLSDEYVNSREFANARFVRNLYERTWSKAALRCSLSGVEKIVLTKEDFIAASGEKEFSEKLSQTRARIGFN